MSASSPHITDDQLLLYVGGELVGKSVQALSAHLHSCLICSARLEQLQCTLKDFTDIQQETVSAASMLHSNARARLKAQLSTATLNEPRIQTWRYLPEITWRQGIIFAVCALVVLISVRGWHGTRNITIQDTVLASEPDVHLTPGAAIPVSMSQVCSESSESSTAIPPALQEKVLKLYGIATGQAGTYEVDYLITPQLGGATDIRNLWPEPYHDTVWNAHVKDQLENRLHQMVCHGDVDLATAQQAISTDWIAAYRKYFHADLPVSGNNSSSNVARRRDPLA